MNLHHLKEFVVLSRKGNFQEAADSLFIAQSTLSKHIKQMEHQLGVPLFDRTTRKVRLTKYGEMLLPYARQMLQIQEACSAELLDALEQEQSSLDIGSIPALAQYRITDVLMHFRRECGHITVNIAQEDTCALKGLLREGRCELAFLRETESRDSDLVRIPFDVDHLVAVMPGDHPLAGAEELPWSHIRDEELLLIERNTMLYDLCVNACKAQGFEPKVAFTDHKLENLADFVGKGMGIALMTNRLARHLCSTGILWVPMAPKVSTQINLCHRKGIRLSAAARHFIRCARRCSPLSQEEGMPAG